MLWPQLIGVIRNCLRRARVKERSIVNKMFTVAFQLSRFGWARKGQKFVPFLIVKINPDDGSAFDCLGGDNKMPKARQWFLDQPRDDGEPTWLELLGGRDCCWRFSVRSTSDLATSPPLLLIHAVIPAADLFPAN